MPSDAPRRPRPSSGRPRGKGSGARQERQPFEQRGAQAGVEQAGIEQVQGARAARRSGSKPAEPGRWSLDRRRGTQARVRTLGRQRSRPAAPIATPTGVRRPAPRPEPRTEAERRCRRGPRPSGAAQADRPDLERAEDRGAPDRALGRRGFDQGRGRGGDQAGDGGHAAPRRRGRSRGAGRDPRGDRRSRDAPSAWPSA